LRSGGSAPAQNHERGETPMSTMKNIVKALKENYMEYVELAYGPFDR
jgi:hypothetical protein